MENINYLKGDILFSKCQTLVNPISCDGLIDRQLSKRFFVKYPDILVKYKYYCDKKLLVPGNLWLYQGKVKRILNFPIKEAASNDVQIEVIEAGFKKFLNTYKEKHITSIAFPSISNPTLFDDGVNVKTMMETFLSDCDIPVEIYKVYVPYSQTLIPLLSKLCGNLDKETVQGLKKSICFEI